MCALLLYSRERHCSQMRGLREYYIFFFKGIPASPRFARRSNPNLWQGPCGEQKGKALSGADLSAQ